MTAEKNIQIKIDEHIYDISISHRAGSNDLVIFIHGLGCSKENFKHVWHHPEYGNISLLTLDLAGYGNSGKPDGFSYTMEDQAGICDAVIRSFPDCNLHIVAHSMGGAVGLLLSDDIFNRTKSFANLEGNLTGKDCFISRKITGKTFENYKTEYLPELKKTLENDKDKLNDLKRSSQTAFYKSCTSLVHWSDNGSLLKKFKALECRKAYFYGDQNTEIDTLKVLNNIPRIMIKNSGHFMMLDNPDEFYAKLKTFQFAL